MIRIILYLLVITLIFSGCTKREIVFDTDVNSNFETTLILQINGMDCAFDAGNKTLRFSASTSQLINFKPTIKFQSYSDVLFMGKSLKNNAKNDFGNLETNMKYSIEFITQGESNTLYLEFTEAPIVQFATIDLIPNEEKILGKMQVQYPNNDHPHISTFIGIEHRGKSSLGLPKKSYGIRPLASANKEDIKSISFFGFRPNDKWSFDALYNDKSKIRNKLSYEVWKSMNQTSIESNYVEVFLNNESKGLYRLGEVFTEYKLSLTSESVLYKGLDNNNFTKFISHSPKQPRSAIWADWEQEYPNPNERISLPF